MGHPDRAKLREKKKKANKEENLTIKNEYFFLDLTPHNAVGRMKIKKFNIRLK